MWGNRHLLPECETEKGFTSSEPRGRTSHTETHTPHEIQQKSASGAHARMHTELQECPTGRLQQEKRWREGGQKKRTKPTSLMGQKKRA